MTLIAVALISVACGDDEPEFTTGNGKTFIENGVMVEANTEFTTSQLIKALREHEWKNTSMFYYDDHKITGNCRDEGLMGPLYLHKDGIAEYDECFPDYMNFRPYVADRKTLIIKAIDQPWYSSTILYDEHYPVVSVDAHKDWGRIITENVGKGHCDALDGVWRLGDPPYDPDRVYYFRMVWEYND